MNREQMDGNEYESERSGIGAEARWGRRLAGKFGGGRVGGGRMAAANGGARARLKRGTARGGNATECGVRPRKGGAARPAVRLWAPRSTKFFGLAKPRQAGDPRSVVSPLHRPELGPGQAAEKIE